MSLIALLSLGLSVGCPAQQDQPVASGGAETPDAPIPAARTSLLRYSLYHTDLDDAGVVERATSMATDRGLTDFQATAHSSEDWALVDDDPYLLSFVSEEQLAEIRTRKQVLLLATRAEGDDLLPSLQSIERLALDLAQSLDAWVWDETAWRLMAPERLQRSLDAWHEGTPDVRTNIIVHHSRAGDLVGLQTSGMEKFGFPDLELSEVLPHYVSMGGDVVNIVAQALIEEGLPPDGDLELHPWDSQNPNFAKSFSGYEGRKATVSLRLAQPPPDASYAPYLEIAIPGDEPQSAKQVALYDDLLNLKGGFGLVQHSPEVVAASERARRRLMEVFKPRFQQGLGSAESLIVKAPFEYAGGSREWMWVDVLQWRGTEIVGVLLNEPEFVPGLSVGDQVTVDEGDVFDYEFRAADGTEEGNETGALLHGSDKPSE